MMRVLKKITIVIGMMFCAMDASCSSRSHNNYLPVHTVRLYKNKPELDVKTLVAFTLLGFGSGVLCQRLEPSCGPVLQLMYLYLWGHVEMECVDRALYELEQQGVIVSSSMIEYSFWVASWMGYFASLADQ